MDINDIIAAFGEDSRLPYDMIASRMALPQTRHGAQRFAKAVGRIGIKHKRQRCAGKVRWCYQVAHFRLYMRTGQAITSAQTEPSISSWEQTRMQLRSAEAKLVYRSDELKKARAQCAAMAAELRRMRGLLSRFAKAAAQASAVPAA